MTVMISVKGVNKAVNTGPFFWIVHILNQKLTPVTIRPCHLIVKKQLDPRQSAQIKFYNITYMRILQYYIYEEAKF